MRRMSRRRKSTLFSAVIVAIAALCTYFFMGGPELPIRKQSLRQGKGRRFLSPRRRRGASCKFNT